MTLSQQEFEKLAPPWDDYALRSPEEIVGRLEQQVHAAKDPAPEAAAGLAIAVGNYEYVGKRRRQVLDAAGSLLDELERERSKYWG